MPSALAKRAARAALTLCLAAFAHAPALAQTCTGSSTINDSTVTPFAFQAGRLTQNGVPSSCAAAKAFPGVTDAGNMRNAKIYNFVNNTNAEACITVTLNAGSCAGATAIFSAAYAGYNPTDLSQNYLADIGASPAPTRSYSFNVPANSEFQVVVYNVNVNQTCPAFTLTVSGFGCPPVSDALISEFRFGVDSTAQNANLDEYVEIYNNTEAPLQVATTDGSAGWSLVAADGSVRFTIPNNTVIPARGHYLGCNSLGYSLAAYPASEDTTATCNATYTADIPITSGVALFRTSNPANFTLANRLDAVGFNGAPLLYRENGLTTRPVSSSGTNYFHVRKLTTGRPQDTGDNANDFVLVSPSPDSGAILGAPGPENLTSPLQFNDLIKASLIDPAVSFGAEPNSVRKTCAPMHPSVESCDRATAANGTFLIRRRFTNTTNSAISRLRFRVVDITTLVGNASGTAPAGQADLRVLTSSPVTVTTTSGAMVQVQGLTREEPPAQPNGGGLNTSLSLALAQPLQSGESVAVQFLLGVQQPGAYRFFVNVEASYAPDTPPPPPGSLRARRRAKSAKGMTR